MKRKSTRCITALLLLSSQTTPMFVHAQDPNFQPQSNVNWNDIASSFQSFNTTLSSVNSNTGSLNNMNSTLTSMNSTLTMMAKYLKEIMKYTKNLGLYLGYDLENYCTSGGNCASTGANGQGSQGGGQASNTGTGAGTGNGTGTGGGSQQTGGISNQLINLTDTYKNQMNMITTFLGAIMPGTTQQNNSGGQSAFQLVPATNSAVANYNTVFQTFAGQSFTKQNPPFTRPNATNFSVSSLIDQQPYQNDPVSQSLLNILATPNDSYCFNPKTGILNKECYTGNDNKSDHGGGPVLSQGQVAINSIGGFSSNEGYPAIGYFALPKDNASLLAQLNSDSLLAPLMFDNSGQGQNNNNPQNQNTAGSKGLRSQNQIQDAENFIRYATSAVKPVILPSREEYSALYEKAANLAGSSDPKDIAEQTKAQITLANYLTSLRVYAAQASVGISNLYYILSKRMPLTSYVSNNNQQISQALSEYVMATWRLQPPTPGSQNNSEKSWFNQINGASAATVQKEMAVLLAEMNYQLYLNRVQQERILLTNSMILLQLSKSFQPNPRLSEVTPTNSNDSLMLLQGGGQ